MHTLHICYVQLVPATRPTIPVAEWTNITVALMMLRQSQFRGASTWGKHFVHTGIMLHGHGASAETQLAKIANVEARAARTCWNLGGFHTLSQNWVATERVSKRPRTHGRIQHKLLLALAQKITDTVPPFASNQVPIVFSLEHALT